MPLRFYYNLWKGMPEMPVFGAKKFGNSYFLSFHEVKNQNFEKNKNSPKTGEPFFQCALGAVTLRDLK